MNLTVQSIRWYQYLLSPLLRSLGAQCRFYPSCSHYATTAFERFGWGQACRLTLRRLFRCHPGHPGGVDLVPVKYEGSMSSPRRRGSSMHGSLSSPRRRGSSVHHEIPASAGMTHFGGDIIDEA